MAPSIESLQLPANGKFTSMAHLRTRQGKRSVSVLKNIIISLHGFNLRELRMGKKRYLMATVRGAPRNKKRVTEMLILVPIIIKTIDIKKNLRMNSDSLDLGSGEMLGK